jgi:hypothetical protein
MNALLHERCSRHSEADDALAAKLLHRAGVGNKRFARAAEQTEL